VNTAYRVWDGEQMHYWDDEGISLTIENDGSWFLWHAFGGGCVVSSDDKDTVLMWGTQLKDETNQEIWEGDIRKDSLGRIFKVVYYDHLAAFYGEYPGGLIQSLADCGQDSEFLGIVYGNPELLEAGE